MMNVNKIKVNYGNQKVWYTSWGGAPKSWPDCKNICQGGGAQGGRTGIREKDMDPHPLLQIYIQAPPETTPFSLPLLFPSSKTTPFCITPLISVK